MKDGRRRLHFWVIVATMPALGAVGFMLAFGGIVPQWLQLLALAVPAYGLGALPAAAIAILHDRLVAGPIGGAGALLACSALAGVFPALVLAALYAAGLIRGGWPLAVLPVAAISAALSITFADLLLRVIDGRPGSAEG